MITAIVFLPLLGAVIAGMLAFVRHGKPPAAAKRIDTLSQWITSGLLVVAMVLSVIEFTHVVVDGQAYTNVLFSWMTSGTFDVNWALKVDTLSAVMLIVVTGVSSMVHIYSIGYMHHDRHIPRFMGYLSLFTFFMLMLVTADNLIQLFFGWEGVGLASYLLIGFWYKRPAANAAAMKAFIVNRVGDLGFAIGIFTIFLLFDSVHLETIFRTAPALADTTIVIFGGEFHALTVACLFLFMGAMGKSAQLGLHTWLPDAMEGPTPVSALIHAATMVTAGVFMVARLSPLFEYSDTALAVVTFVGGTTAIFAATIGCVQNDIKRVIAYSTCSQLGYMFFALGVSAYGAGIFHLLTHAFFKALLFLGAGSVIHAMSDEQDMRKMGGIWKMIPVTYVLMWIGSLALAGIPPFAGFYSKDIVLEAAWAAGTGMGAYAFWMGLAAAFLTAFYSWRLLFMTFHGTSRADDKVLAHVHESPKVILIPLIVLGAGAILSGYVGYDAFVGEGRDAFWQSSLLVLDAHPALEQAHFVPLWVKLSPLFIAVAGIILAWVLYIIVPTAPAKLASRFPRLYGFLLNKWYVDELYDRIFVRPSLALGRVFWKHVDGGVIDALGPDGIASAVRTIAKRVAALQSGYVYHYAFAMILGATLFMTWHIVRAAG